MSLDPFCAFHHFAVLTTFVEIFAATEGHSFLTEQTHIYLSLTLLCLSQVTNCYTYRFTNHAPFNIYFSMLLHCCTCPPYYYTSHSYSAFEELNFRMSRCNISYVSVNLSSLAFKWAWAISYCSATLAFSSSNSSIYFPWRVIKSFFSASKCNFCCVNFFFNSMSLIY